MRCSRLEIALFVTCLVAFAYFHHGGGWNQNVRFAMVRAMVEARTFAVDSFLVYRPAPGGSGETLVRLPVTDGRFEWEGRTYYLGWGRAGGAGSAIPARLDEWAVSGDLAFHAGRFHPNKAPGVAFAAVPAYAVLYGIDKLAGADPDSWWILTVNAWLTSLLSVGLISAAGCVLVFRLALRVSDGAVVPSLVAALTCALGTIFFHYACTLYEHDVAAIACIAAFYFLVRAKEERALRDLMLAGVCVGYAATTNTIFAAVAILLGAYLVVSVRVRHGWLAYGLGILGPLAMLLAYNVACFGTPFTTNYAYENPLFRNEAAVLGVFSAPSASAFAALLISPFRGLFYTSPVLLAAVAGLALMLRDSRHRAEAWVVASVAGFFLLFNMSFNGWAGGSAVGPRYLVPAIPFLTVPLAIGFARWPRIVAALAVVSAAVVMLSAAVDPQCPQYVVQGRPMWKFDPVREYVLPLFLRGTPDTIADAWRDGLLSQAEREMVARGLPPDARAAKLAALRRSADDIVEGRDPGNPLGHVRGPVSANPIGIVEGGYYALHPPDSTPSAWNAFNAGEFLFPGSRLSLLPLVLLLGGCGFWMAREARRRPSLGA